MIINKAIEEIRKTRHDISEKYHHNTKEIIEHYKQMENAYSDRMYIKKPANKSFQGTAKSSRP